jgi:hypothetical protein
MSTLTLYHRGIDETATQARRDMVMTTPYQALTHLLHLTQGEPVPEDDIVLTDDGPVLPTDLLLGTPDCRFSIMT